MTNFDKLVTKRVKITKEPKLDKIVWFIIILSALLLTLYSWNKHGKQQKIEDEKPHIKIEEKAVHYYW